ncbi:MAG TPA: zinc-ribbon domain-containing protein [Candidatus Acidoferrum sp.]|nr:zinc-ribbon domain-containing protein [Candidatus Acidoferrum sp.]
MPYCPQCGETYRDGYTTCTDCGAQLLPGTAPKGFAPAGSPLLPLTDLVPVAGSWGNVQTAILVSLLASCGIRVRLFGCSSPAELMSGTTGIRAILVDARDAVAAKEILEAGPAQFLTE